MNGTLHEQDGRLVLRFERVLAHPPEKVWRALTDPAELSRWFAGDVEGTWAPGGTLRFVVYPDGAPVPMGEGTILTWEPSRLLVYTWSYEGRGDVLRWELHAEGTGCRLIFLHTLDDPRPQTADHAAGWHGCLDALEARLAGRPVAHPPTEGRAPAHRAFWAALEEDYRRRFGV